LDTVVVAPLDVIVDAPALGELAITDDPASKHKPRTRDSFGRAIVRKFNSSVMAWHGGTHTNLYTDWTPAVSDRLSGDQDWLGEHAGNVLALPREWFPRISECPTGIPARARVVFAKVPKNHLAVDDPRYRWVREYWGAPVCA
jgi:hypothetical protein